MNERGQYGATQVGKSRQDVQHWARSAPASSEDTDPSLLPQVEWPSWMQGLAAPAVTLGIGTILGILIGSKMTFHAPLRRRR